MGELSKLLLGAEPRRRSGSRATPACSSRSCRSSSARSGSTRSRRYHDADGRRAHLRGRAGGRRRRRRRCACGSPRSSTTSASRTWPGAAPTGGSTSTHGTAGVTTRTSARSSPTPRCGGCATRTSSASASSGSSASTCSTSADADALRARRLLARYGDGLALDLLDHKEADLIGKGEDGPRDEREARAARGASAAVVEQELGSPHRLVRPRRRRHRPDRARLPPGPGARARARRAARRGRRRPVAEPARDAARARRGDTRRMIRWERARAVRGRLHDAGRRRQRRRLRVAQPRRTRRRPRAGRGEPAARLRGARARRDTPLAEPAAPLADRSPGRARGPGRAGRRALDRRARRQPMLALAADCVPIAVATTEGAPGVSPSLHAGWRGLAEGVVEAGVRALGDARTAAIVGAVGRPVLLRGRSGGVGALRRRPDRGRDPRPVVCGRACARPRRRRGGRAPRPLHALQPGALLLASAKRPARAARRE